MYKPGALPCKICSKDAIGTCSICLAATLDDAPVNSDFFLTVYPVTTTSSNLLFRALIVILIFFSAPILRVCVSKLTLLKLKALALGPTVIR